MHRSTHERHAPGGAAMGELDPDTSDTVEAMVRYIASDEKIAAHVRCRPCQVRAVRAALAGGQDSADRVEPARGGDDHGDEDFQLLARPGCVAASAELAARINRMRREGRA